MIGTLSGGVMAAAVFVGVPFLSYSQKVRTLLIARLGDGGFRGVYFIFALASFA